MSFDRRCAETDRPTSVCRLVTCPLSRSAAASCRFVWRAILWSAWRNAQPDSEYFRPGPKTFGLLFSRLSVQETGSVEAGGTPMAQSGHASRVAGQAGGGCYPGGRGVFRRRVFERAVAVATARAMAESEVMRITKTEMVRVLHAEPAFAEMFIAHLLIRNSRIEEDLVDQLFN